MLARRIGPTEFPWGQYSGKKEEKDVQQGKKVDCIQFHLIGVSRAGIIL